MEKTKNTALNNEEIIKEKSSWFLSIVVFINVLAPNLLIWYAVQLMILLYLIILNSSYKNQQHLRYFLSIVIFLALPLSNVGHTLKDYIQVFNIVLFVLFCPIYLPKANYHKVLVLIATIIIGSQLAFAFEYAPLIHLIQVLFPVDEASEVSSNVYGFFSHTNVDISFFRFGGLYRNPNKASNFFLLILCIYLASTPLLKEKKVWGFVFLIAVGVLLTGSRTGMVVFSSITLLWLYRIKAFSALYMGMIALLSVFILELKLGLRSFNISSSHKGSLSYKINILIDYIGELLDKKDYITLLLGNFGIESFRKAYTVSHLYNFSLDSGMGYIIYSFGIIGFFLFLLFLWKIFSAHESFMILLPILLLLGSTSIFFHIKYIYSFFIFVSIMYSNSLPHTNLSKKKLYIQSPNFNSG